MNSAAITLLAEVIAGQERIIERLKKLEHVIDYDRTRVDTIARIVRAREEDLQAGLRVVESR